jgi:hypothetical protein
MGKDRFSGSNPKQSRGAKRDAGASGERRNKPGGPVRPTEGRVFSRRGGVALLCRWRPIAMRSAPGHDTKSSRSNGSIWSESALDLGDLSSGIQLPSGRRGGSPRGEHKKGGPWGPPF